MSNDRRCGVLAVPGASADDDIGTPLYEETRLALESAQQDLPDDPEPVWPTEEEAEQAARRARQQVKPSPTDRLVIDPLTPEGRAILELHRGFQVRVAPTSPASDAEIVAFLGAWLCSVGLGD